MNKLKNISKILLVVLVICISASCSTKPQITMDPVKDAETCIKLYKKNPYKAQEYMTAVMFKYDQEGNIDKELKFSDIVSRKIAEINMEY